MADRTASPGSATEYDVIVVGGGPGGSSAASFCSRAGLRTLLLEKSKYPRDKTCGDAISGKSIAVLRELGLHTWIEKEPYARANGVVFSSPAGDVVQIPFPKKIDPASMKDQRTYKYIDPGYVVRRLVFDNIVFSYAKKQENVTAIEEFAVTDVVIEEGFARGVTGKHKDGREQTFRAKVVIGADGALSKVASAVGAYDFENKNHDHWIGAFRWYADGITDLTDDIEIHFVDGLLPGYFWIFPVDNGAANVGAGMVETDLQAKGPDGKKKVNMKEITFEIIKSHPMFKERFKNATTWEGSFKGWQLPCGSERRTLAGNGWMLVGDAGGLIDPFSGEGIGNALVSGRYAAEYAALAIKKGDVSKATLAAYEARIWKELGHELDMSYKLQKMGRHTWLLNWVLRKAATKPAVRALISDMLADREKKEQLTGWWSILKILLLPSWMLPKASGDGVDAGKAVPPQALPRQLERARAAEVPKQLVAPGQRK
ncbi:MAG TPA: geranylgeranyl reductase family protein [Candidatus Thermoplasmatota archaeon]|nr:geranylgeranyl reductase family protein [Candidatus Thermoplasmatota archaeon]